MTPMSSSVVKVTDQWDEGKATFTEDGVTILVCRPAFVVSLYRHTGLHLQAQAILDAWIKLIPAKTELWYSHEKSKRFAKLTPKALEKIRDDYAPKKLKKVFSSYFIKSAPKGGQVDECHQFSFEMYAVQGHSGYAYMTFPLDHTETQSAKRVVDGFGDWCQRFELTHAGAGYGHEMAWFNEQTQMAGPLLLETGLRFHGVRVWNRSTERFRALTKNTLDTVAWLTYLDHSSVQNLQKNSIEKIHPEVIRHHLDSGILLQAGDTPSPCDSRNRGKDYERLKSVNDAIVPIRTTKWYQNYWATWDDATKENNWFSRMDETV